jgi:hypothetical protein
MTINASNPSADHDPRLEAELAAMSRWEGESPKVWATVLGADAPRRRGVEAIFTRRIGGPLLLLILLPLILVPMLLPALGKARSSHGIPVASSRVELDLAGGMSADRFDVEGRKVDMASSFSEVESAPASRALSASAQADSRDRPAADARPTDSPARLVARKASIDLAVPDVRAAFAKAAFLISEAGGEFVEDSTLTGEGERAQANLTLRIRAERLSQVLGQLRDLGIVVQETSRGEDVTDQAVDLDARLRNEQRIETELAQLLAGRKDAPLKDIMEVRDSLSRVRESIERLTAQRDRLSRRVSLSTILVVIRHESAVRLPETAKPDGFGAYFSKTIAVAWRTATRALADTVAFIVTVVVGGAIWWVIAAIVGVAAFRWRARARAAQAREPAPVL